MCGICGFARKEWSKERSRETIARMCDLLRHRGPDDQGIFVDEHFALGHTRLSIIDLSAAGHQPMSLKNAPYWITYNGEIYNFPELKKELQSRGMNFHTATDTEVILKAYEMFGDDCVTHLNGMFAFAIWDARQQKLLLARDRLGKKPLFYYHKDETFIFASEMKAILAVPGISNEIDYEALNLYLHHNYIPAPWTIFKHIRKLREAHLLTLQNGSLYEPVPSLREKPYWQLPAPEDIAYKNENDAADELDALLTEAVRCRMISDVPLGAFLSGGIDSSAIVAMMAKINSEPVKTFTIDFAEAEFSEREDAEVVAKHCKTDHHMLRVKTDAIDLLPKLVWHFDEPFGDSSAIPTYYVSKMAREHVTVILSGDGGDELFAGYNSYLKKDEHEKFLRLPKRLRKAVFGKVAHALPIQTPMRNFLLYVAEANKGDGADALGTYPYIKNDLITTDLREHFNGCNAFRLREQFLPQTGIQDKLSRLQYLDAKRYLPGDILVKVDRMSMANSLETRAPLLDYRLVEFAFRLPVELKINGTTTKYLLKKVLARYVPQEILNKRKHGFAVPIKNWFQTT
ncbi:MAG: asparagine synthase (glutamine-hydrolyzing), partial [bacterium]